MSADGSVISEHVEFCSEWASRLVKEDADRHGGGVRAAAGRIARRVRSTSSAIMALCYEPPKSVSADLYEAMIDLVEREITREMEALTNELDAVRSRRRIPHAREISQIHADLEALRLRMRTLRNETGAA